MNQKISSDSVDGHHGHVTASPHKADVAKCVGGVASDKSLKFTYQLYDVTLIYHS